MSTIDYYNKNAKAYFDKTVDARMVEQYNIFLKHVKFNGKILDFGCGSGRDSLAFKNMGFSLDEVIEVSKEKSLKRGSFSKRIFLEKTTD